MESKTRGIVLRTVKINDNKLIVDFLSREEGRLSAVWKITTSRTSKVRRQYFQPMTILNVNLERSPRQHMSRIKEAQIAIPYSSISLDGNKMAITFFLAEFMNYATRSMHTDALLYDFVEQSLTWLDASNKGIANFHLMFMVRMSLFLGFQPDMSTYEEGALFDLREGAMTDTVPLHSAWLSPEESALAPLLLRMDFNTMHLFRLNREQRRRILDVLTDYYRLHVPEFPELKSLEILREILGN